MPDRVRPTDLGLHRLLWVFAVFSLALLITLVIAPVRSHFTEWRAMQKRYNTSAAQIGTPGVTVGIKQIWRPELDRVDRCVSCHLGMGDATPSPHELVFRAHPPMPHEPRDLGCTICHRGQGRATTARAAHGEVAFWDDPMLDKPYREASCGVCHSGVVVAGLASGQRVFERAACDDCHRVDGKGGADGPDLSRVGIAGFSSRWHATHVAHSTTSRDGDSARRWKATFRALSADEIRAVEGFLRGRIGAPRLVAGKALAHELGCRGCHRINGVGGDEGPDLANTGGKNARELDYAGVAGSHTLGTWLREHFLDPARVVPGSQMPDLGVTDPQAELLALYMMSLRVEPLPAAQVPRDRLRIQLGEREFGGDGASVFAAFCVGCHGTDGRGRRFGVGDYTFPAIGAAQFLAVVDDGLLRASITNGRPGRKMPAWGTKAGGLTADEIDRVVSYLRSLEPPAPTYQAVMAAELVAGLGARRFAEDCRPCHGARGEGSAIGSRLRTTDDRQIYDVLVAPTTGMGSFASYDPTALRAVIDRVRTLATGSGTAWAAPAGSAIRGESVYRSACVGCHGERGRGNAGPALGNAAFLAAASDAYLRSVIVRGRGETAMPRFGRGSVGHRELAADEVADVVAFVRSLAPPPTAKAPP